MPAEITVTRGIFGRYHRQRIGQFAQAKPGLQVHQPLFRQALQGTAALQFPLAHRKCGLHLIHRQGKPPDGMIGHLHPQQDFLPFGKGTAGRGLEITADHGIPRTPDHGIHAGSQALPALLRQFQVTVTVGFDLDLGNFSPDPHLPGKGVFHPSANQFLQGKEVYEIPFFHTHKYNIFLLYLHRD